jgi:gamma-glutamylcyclotransferase
MAGRNPEEGYANIVPDSNDMVEGALYDIEPNALPKLDDAEGYPKHYLKIPVRVTLPDERADVCAIAYVASLDMTREGLKPTRGYLIFA